MDISENRLKKKVVEKFLDAHHLKTVMITLYIYVQVHIKHCKMYVFLSCNLRNDDKHIKEL